MKQLQQTWRWYGPDDPVSLADIRQAGATGVVTALHHVPIGEVWELEEIAQRQSEIADMGLTWSVVESLAVHEEIKTAGPQRDQLLDNYRISLQNLASRGIRCVCYNFMPALDWTRTHLNAPVADGSTALSFDLTTFAVFDLHILKRENASADYPESIVEAAHRVFAEMDQESLQELEHTVIAGLPGANQGFGLPEFRTAIERYQGVTADDYRANVAYFLHAVMPVAIENDVLMGVHPDDPPFSILGLPRIVSTASDARKYLEAFDHPNNGLTFCTGSFGARPDNDLPAMVREFGERIHFVHLRNVSIFNEKCFVEDNHLEGDSDMYAIMKELVKLDRDDLPYRPDHGHRMLFELNQKVNPGYSAIGRLRGLAELRGLELGIRRSRAETVG